MKSLEDRFRNTKRTHNFLEDITLVKPPAAPAPVPQTVPLRNRQPEPVRPPIEVLEGLRQDWLTQESTPTRNTEATARPRRKPRPKRSTPFADYTPFLEALKSSIRRRLSPPTEGRNVRNRQERSTLAVAGAMVAGIAILILIGALLYAASVNSLTDLIQPSATARPVDANISIAGQTTQAGALGAATDPAAATPSSPNTAVTIVSDSDSASPASQFRLPRLNLDQANAPGATATDSTSHPEQAADGFIQALGSTSAPSLPPGTPNPPPASPATGHPVLPPATGYAPAASSLSLVRAGQGLLQKSDLRGAYQSAAQAKALDPNSLPALQLMQTVLAQAGDPHAAQVSALDAIAHGGKAVFELQHIHASPATLHPARIVITASTLEFLPEGPCTLGSFTIPLSSITAVQMRADASGPASLPVLNIRFDGSGSSSARAAKGELSFRDASAEFRNANFSSRLSPAQQTALFNAIRNVLLAPKARS